MRLDAFKAPGVSVRIPGAGLVVVAESSSAEGYRPDLDALGFTRQRLTRLGLSWFQPAAILAHKSGSSRPNPSRCQSASLVLAEGRLHDPFSLEIQDSLIDPYTQLASQYRATRKTLDVIRRSSSDSHCHGGGGSSRPKNRLTSVATPERPRQGAVFPPRNSAVDCPILSLALRPPSPRQHCWPPQALLARRWQAAWMRASSSKLAREISSRSGSRVFRCHCESRSSRPQLQRGGPRGKRNGGGSSSRFCVSSAGTL